MVSCKAIHLGVRSCDAMYRMQESKSKLELFYRLSIELFLSYYFGRGFKHVWTEFETIATYTEVI